MFSKNSRKNWFLKKLQGKKSLIFGHKMKFLNVTSYTASVLVDSICRFGKFLQSIIGFRKSLYKAFLPKCWNALSLDHKNTISHSSFKKYIREDLINEYNEFTCTNNNCSSCSFSSQRQFRGFETSVNIIMNQLCIVLLIAIFL